MDGDTTTWERVLRRNDAVIEREIAGETLLVPVRGRLAQLHRLFVLDPVGVFIWRRIDGSHDLGAIRTAIVDAFEVADDQAGRDLLAYVASLEEAELVSARDAPPAAAPTAAESPR